MRTIVVVLVMTGMVRAQHEGHESHAVKPVDAQPLLAQVLRLDEALSFLGSPLPEVDSRKLRSLQHEAPSEKTVALIADILDPYCLAVVNINPEARVKVTRGPATASLIQSGWTTFLVKVHNDAGVTAPLEVESPNMLPPVHAPSMDPRVKEKNVITPGQVANRFVEMLVYRNRPLLPRLSGLGLEYAVLQVYSKDAGQREVEIGFNVGQGSQDIGFRNSIHVLFNIKPAVKVKLKVKDADGSPAMASFIITDGVERIHDDSTANLSRMDFHLAAALREYRGNRIPKKLRGVYPLPSRRVAAYDDYPDFFFHPQIYRFDGEHVMLAPGTYNVSYTRGPEYERQERTLVIPENETEVEASFQLKRWLNMAALGWYSSDHHIHAAGCSHYDSPEQGVAPEDMWRQLLGEDLNVAASLAWGPSWYHQKTFFTGEDEPYSTPLNILHNDVEVSGFPSSHAGHVVLLGLKEDDYPGTTVIEDWPSWTLPVLRWARAQGGIVGYAHSGWGLEPVSKTDALPNYVLPKMDGIGANEYIVTVTQGIVDFYSAGDTPAPWELNMWYQTLNAGFRVPLSGETDFPCIFDERVGLARSYFKPDGAPGYDTWMEAMKQGRSYVTDGASHIIDFTVDGVAQGSNAGALAVASGATVTIRARAVANLPAQQDSTGAAIASRALDEQPYWHLERARIGKTRRVKVALIVNGEPVDSQVIEADGTWKNISFTRRVEASSWIALRIYPSVHTNPFYVEVDGSPVRVLESARWCRKAVDQCWKMKRPQIREPERAAAAEAYEAARKVYDAIIEDALR